MAGQTCIPRRAHFSFLCSSGLDGALAALPCRRPGSAALLLVPPSVDSALRQHHVGTVALSPGVWAHGVPCGTSRVPAGRTLVWSARRDSGGNQSSPRHGCAERQAHALSALAATASVVALLRWLEGSRVRWVWWFCLASLATLLLQMFAILAPFSVLVAAIALKPRMFRGKWRALIAPTGLILAAAVSFAILGVSQRSQIAWIPSPFAGAQLMRAVAGPASGGHDRYAIFVLAIVIAAIAAGLWAGGRGAPWTRSPRPPTPRHPGGVGRSPHCDARRRFVGAAGVPGSLCGLIGSRPGDRPRPACGLGIQWDRRSRGGSVARHCRKRRAGDCGGGPLLRVFGSGRSTDIR